MSETEHVWWNRRNPPVPPIKTALRRMGLYVYSDPIYDGMVISKKKLTRSEVRKKCREAYI